MYFSATVNGLSHLWRQRFPNGEPQQLTSEAPEEAGVAIAKDGRSVISAVGMRESGVWLHDLRGERAISSEGYASLPSFSRDGALAYYLLRRQSIESPPELWVTELQSGKSHPVVDGVSITSYEVSPDGKEAVFAARSPDGGSQLWRRPATVHLPLACLRREETTPSSGMAMSVLPRLRGTQELSFPDEARQISASESNANAHYQLQGDVAGPALGGCHDSRQRRATHGSCRHPRSGRRDEDDLSG
jgi:hypothetical protein